MHKAPTSVAASAAWRQAIVAGSLASLLSTGVLAFAGRRQAGSAAAPLNAVSHWYWGDPALHRQRADVTHTGTGYLTHHMASVFWAGLLATASRRAPVLRSPRGIAWGSVATSALACFVDFRLTPQRFTPGFEHRLSRPVLAGVYAAFAVGLALGAAAVHARGSRDSHTRRRPAAGRAGRAAP